MEAITASLADDASAYIVRVTDNKSCFVAKATKFAYSWRVWKAEWVVYRLAGPSGSIMSQVTQSAEGGQQRKLALVEISVVLLASPTDPSILNPDFLRHNEIIDKTLELKAPAISTPMFSRIEFDEEIVVSAEPNRFVFEQKVSHLEEGDIAVLDIVNRFLGVVVHPNYSAIGINPKAIRTSGRSEKFEIANALIEGGAWMAFKDVVPEVQLKAVYNFEKRRISLDVSGIRLEDENGSIHQGLLYQANIHRDLQGTNGTERIEEAQAVISACREDIADFHRLVDKFETLGVRS